METLFNLASRSCARVLCSRKLKQTSEPREHELADCSAAHACVWISVFHFGETSSKLSRGVAPAIRLESPAIFQALVPPTRAVYSSAVVFLWVSCAGLPLRGLRSSKCTLTGSDLVDGCPVYPW